MTLELTPRQRKILEELFAAGFRPIAIAPYESALCVRRGNCAALLAPESKGGLQLLAAPSYLVDGNLSARVRRRGKDVFVWKQKEVEATPERSAELEQFRRDLLALLEQSSAARDPT